MNEIWKIGESLQRERGGKIRGETDTKRREKKGREREKGVRNRGEGEKRWWRMRHKRKVETEEQ